MQITASTLFAQKVYTPNGSAVEVNSYSAGNVANFEYNASLTISSNGWANLVTKTADATGVYNCHAYAWSSTSYWMNAATKAALAQFNNIQYNNPNATPPSHNNLYKYWADGSYIEVTENTATTVFYGYDWVWTPFYGWVCPNDHSAKRITSGANAGKYESKWGQAGRYIHPSDICPYDDSQRRFFKLNPSPHPAYYVGINSFSYSGESTIYAGSSGNAVITLNAYTSQSPSPNSYVWSASWNGSCDRWYIWPSGSRADISLYLYAGHSGGMLRIECEMYNGSTLLGATTYYLSVYP